MKKFLMFCFCILAWSHTYAWEPDNNGMMVRIAEIEIYPEYRDDYLVLAGEIAETSVRTEPGVIAIYPMTEIKNAVRFRILEIYKDEQAYRKHIASDHFLRYKKGTLHMVKSLNLVDMYQVAPATFGHVFRKK